MLYIFLFVQGFAATLGVAKGDVILKRKDIDLLRRTKGLKIGFSAEVRSFKRI